MKKNTAVLIVTLLLVCSFLLTACASGKTAGTTGSSTETSEQTAAAPVTTAVKEEVELDPLSIALAKEILLGDGVSKTEFVKAMSKVSVHQAEAELIASELEVDFSVQALKAAYRLVEGGFTADRAQKLLSNSGYTESEMAFAMDNCSAAGAADIISEEMAKYELSDEENELLAAYHGN